MHHPRPKKKYLRILINGTGTDHLDSTPFTLNFFAVAVAAFSLLGFGAEGGGVDVDAISGGQSAPADLRSCWDAIYKYGQIEDGDYDIVHPDTGATRAISCRFYGKTP